MDREADQIRMRQILTATIASLCRNSLSYSGELSIQGLLGITIDHKDILLVNINETLRHAGSTTVGQQCQKSTHANTEYVQSCSVQPSAIKVEQSYASNDGVAVGPQKHVVNTSKSKRTSKKRVSH